MAAGNMCMIKSKEETAEWTGLFLNELKTKQESLVFVKRMVAVAVSCITYLRGIFPELAYRSRYLEDVSIKVLRENCNAPGASKVVKWLMGCFDALERQYLQIICMGVYTNPEDPNCIIESYKFNFRYTEKGPEMDILRNDAMMTQVTLDDTKRASVLLIRKLFLLMQNLEALPENVYLTMKLYYYDDVTPADYEPPGFKEGVSDSMLFEGTPAHFKLGEVHTAYHSLKVQVSVEKSQVEKLQKGVCLQENKRASPEKKQIKYPSVKRHPEGDLPSEDESAQFKKPKRQLVKLQQQRYICTYRFSQDHMELLFNSIRASGGWNNNPSAGQFQAIFRRLMVRCGVSPSRSGNVAIQDETVFLQEKPTSFHPLSPTSLQLRNSDTVWTLEKQARSSSTQSNVAFFSLTRAFTRTVLDCDVEQDGLGM
ncbi:zebrafish testis-expressed 38 [Cololabis saira]|uniref:zebrafish testis-expressed 38 n=1 Tax=Cololabis saira TaxID=129043 RepID=UPI002AD2AC5A|nr:zebrafish testis-expressed 38 [Cololabis saira]